MSQIIYVDSNERKNCIRIIVVFFSIEFDFLLFRVSACSAIASDYIIHSTQHKSFLSNNLEINRSIFKAVLSELIRLFCVIECIGYNGSRLNCKRK